MPHHSLAAAIAMWQSMMLIMMAPLVWRWVAVLSAVSEGGSVPFTAGYATAWLPYSVGAAALQHILRHAPWLTNNGRIGGVAAGLVLIAAGAFQFAPLKRACLRHCRNPLTYFLTRWHNGPPNRYRIGVVHGLYCVGCCWALMSTALVVGTMNIAWMLCLALLGVVEQLAPHGERIGRAAGVALAIYGLAVLLR